MIKLLISYFKTSEIGNYMPRVKISITTVKQSNAKWLLKTNWLDLVLPVCERDLGHV